MFQNYLPTLACYFVATSGWTLLTLLLAGLVRVFLVEKGQPVAQPTWELPPEIFLPPEAPHACGCGHHQEESHACGCGHHHQESSHDEHNPSHPAGCGCGCGAPPPPPTLINWVLTYGYGILFPKIAEVWVVLWLVISALFPQAESTGWHPISLACALVFAPFLGRTLWKNARLRHIRRKRARYYR